ncbi:hypothetical protein MN116_005699 [Schistosoma mekongi]|uniref:Uncharacterized protein n=1 Tax=Schistosoma mekongi TaxID=38744 RepID=A0AAE1ZAB7_SCHME|nr:hypothetical protein MN116_005699 [Schistosoma mekongi]
MKRVNRIFTFCLVPNNDEVVNVEYFDLVNFIICDVDENDFVALEDDGDEVVIIGCHEVSDGDDGDDEMLGVDMMNITGEVMIDGVDVICDEHCYVEYFGCVDAIGCSAVNVGVEVCVDCKYKKVGGDVTDENRVDVSETIEVDSNDLVVNELSSTSVVKILKKKEWKKEHQSKQTG